MREFNQQFQLMDSFSASFGGATSRKAKAGNNRLAHKSTESAAPMEKLGQRGAEDNGKKYLCPKCREGSLRKIKGKNGDFWGCSNYPRCTATFDDDHNMPLLNN